jgi:DNA-binding CsgD family transcriptional regulator
VGENVISDAALALYELLVTAAALPLGSELDVDDPAVRELLDQGFAELEPGPPPRLRPLTPIAAFRPVLARLQEEFLQQQNELLDAYTYLDDLQQRFLDSQPRSEAEALAEVRTDPNSFDAAVTELLLIAEDEVLSWNLSVGELIEASATSRVGRTRTVYDRPFLQREGGSAAVARAREVGEELRIADQLPTSMLIVDTTALVLPLSGGTAGALLIRSPLVVAAMRELFELIWQRSVPWIDRAADAEGGLPPVQRQIIALMSVGHSDEDIAEQLGISLRTVRRHIADFMDSLGASTRFAAGIAAVQAGLLDEPVAGEH